MPRIEMLAVQGGIGEIKRNQLEREYGDLYRLITNPLVFEGDILTYKAPLGLPYYITDVKFVDLSYAANLAHFKNSFQLKSTLLTIMSLQQQGVRYILVNPSITKTLDASLNYSISNILNYTELVTLSEVFGKWELYRIDVYRIKETLFYIKHENKN